MDKVWLNQYPEGVPPRIDPDAWPSVVALFEHSARRFTSRPAFTEADTTLTYSDIDRRSRDFAAYLQSQLGIDKQDCVAVMLPNRLPFPVALFGAMRTGARITHINPLYTARELEHQLDDSGAKVLIIDARSMPVLQEALDRTQVETLIVVDPPTVHTPSDGATIRAQQTIDFESALNLGKAHPLQPVDIDRQDILFLQYTGGTTGLSKGAALTHRNLIANVLQFKAAVGPILAEGQEIVVTALPLYHIFALSVNCLSMWHYGAHNLLIGNPRNLDRLVEQLAPWRFTVLTGVNTLFNGLLNSPHFCALDFSELKLCIGGGASIQRVVADRWATVTGTPILEGYGLSETAPLLTLNPCTTVAFSGSIGLPVPSTELCLRDDSGNPVAIGQTGELCARGPQVMRGYWRRDRATRDVTTDDGFFRTGDIARMDEKGYFYIVDRIKDVILVSGFNVYPNEIEGVAARFDGVLECACIGVPDPKTGEAVKLFVVEPPGADLDLMKLRQHCKKHLAAYKVPKRIELIDTLPKSTVGKILRRKLRSRP